MEYLLHLIVLWGLYTVLALSLDLVAGWTGLLSTAHAAFFGLGAYGSALVVAIGGGPAWLGLVAGMTVAAVASLLVSLPSLRLNDDYFILAAFGFQIIISSVLVNWFTLTRGPLGIAGVPRFVVFGLRIDSTLDFAVVSVIAAAITFLVTGGFVGGAWGRVLRAIREHESFAQALGKNVLFFKVATFGVSAMLAAMAGTIFAHYFTYVDPSSFTIVESIFILAVVVIGGAGSRWGPVAGALVLVALPEILRFGDWAPEGAAKLRQILYGGLLAAMMILRPQGLFGNNVFDDRGQEIDRERDLRDDSGAAKR